VDLDFNGYIYKIKEFLFPQYFFNLNDTTNK